MTSTRSVLPLALLIVRSLGLCDQGFSQQGVPPGFQLLTDPQTSGGLLIAQRHELAGLATLRSEHPAEDGSARLVVALADGQTVESVLLPRDGLCVSSQVGCAVGCRFCMTGQGGLLRQLGSAEIVAQVAHARRQRAVRNVVFMGMGEPRTTSTRCWKRSDCSDTAGGIGHKMLVLSSVGDERLFERLLAPDAARRVRPALALSLHSTDAERRAALLPRAPREAQALDTEGLPGRSCETVRGRGALLPCLPRRLGFGAPRHT